MAGPPCFEHTTATLNRGFSNVGGDRAKSGIGFALSFARYLRLDEIDAVGLGIYFDPAHVVAAGRDPIAAGTHGDAKESAAQGFAHQLAVNPQG